MHFFLDALRVKYVYVKDTIFSTHKSGRIILFVNSRFLLCSCKLDEIKTNFDYFSHKNIHVRKTTSLFLVKIVSRMGPGRVLSGVKDVTDRIVPTTAQFAMDSSPETR